ncbi:MAG: hypothetical protein KFH87_09640 [Bacteroidetes bacterium]|nr:hypothetical protein [Bacteroidota bacterium]
MPETCGEGVSLRRLLFVFVLVLMLSLNPVPVQRTVAVEAPRIVYVMSRRKRRPGLRGRRRRYAWGGHDCLNTNYSLQGS